MQDEHSGWLQPASGPVSHAEAAAALERANRAAALAAAAVDESSSSDEGDGALMRCCISWCKRQLLRCFGQKRDGCSVGCAENSHHICAPCLYRWLGSERSLREQEGLAHQMRRTCPVCKSELRAAGSDIRANADNYVMGLLKVEDTW